MKNFVKFLTESSWSPSSKVWPPVWKKSNRLPTFEQWKIFWATEVPVWSHTTQKQWQDLAMSEIKASGADALMAVTPLAFRYYNAAFHSYFKQRWGVTIPNEIHSKIMNGDGTVKWGGEKYSAFSETRELCFAMITQKNKVKS